MEIANLYTDNFDCLTMPVIINPRTYLPNIPMKYICPEAIVWTQSLNRCTGSTPYPYLTLHSARMLGTTPHVILQCMYNVDV